MGTSTSRNSNSAGSANPSASGAPGLRVPRTPPATRDKAIAASDDRRDVSVAGLVICQGTTQRGNTDLEIALSDEGLGPDLRDQLRLADDLARAFDKGDQEIEGATADRDGLATFQQKSSCPEQPERTKGYFELGRVILAINCLDRDSALVAGGDVCRPRGDSEPVVVISGILRLAMPERDSRLRKLKSISKKEDTISDCACLSANRLAFVGMCPPPRRLSASPTSSVAW